MCISQTFLLFFAAVKQGAKTAGRVFEAPKNHVGRAPPQHCFTFQGPTRFGAVVLTQSAGFNPKLVRQWAWPRSICVAQTTATSNSLASALVIAADRRSHAVVMELQPHNCTLLINRTMPHAGGGVQRATCRAATQEG